MTTWISRASVLRIIDEEPVYSDVINEKTYMASQIKDLPTKEDSDRPHGEWIDVNGDGSIMKCSRCGEEVCCKDNNFCPNCGSDNRRKDEEKLEKKEDETSTQNPCIRCCRKLSCHGICEKRYLWNLREGGEAE